jgi:hypothetical protein
MKITLVAMFILIFNSCVVDSLHELTIIQNNSKRNISVIFSSEENINKSIIYSNYKNFMLSKYTSKSYFKEYITDSNKIITVYFLDYDSINKFITANSDLIKKSVLQQQTVDLRKLNISDTLFYKE